MTGVLNIFICILCNCYFVTAAPYAKLLFSREQQNETNVDLKVGWASSPNVRGTFDILLSSLTTLALCSWTAYHPNIKPRLTLWRSFWIRAMWMILVIILPEAVLFIAWDQRAAAIEIRNYMNKRTEKERRDSDIRNQNGSEQVRILICGER